MKGLADDGGLFVPESIPKLDVTLDELKRDVLSGNSLCCDETDFLRILRRKS